MEKKESLKTEADSRVKQPSAKGRLSGFSAWAFGVIKFVLGVCLLPFVYSTNLVFLKEAGGVNTLPYSYFWLGIFVFLVIYLFVLEPAAVYAKGQRLLEILFSFFQPLVKVAPYLLPVYTILIFLVAIPLSFIVKEDWLLKYSLFFIGLSAALHLVFSAKTLRSKKDDFLKSNYLFGFSFIYIVNLYLLAFGFSLILKDFSFIRFFNNAFQVAQDIFTSVFRQLFL